MKHRKRVPAWLHGGAMHQAEAARTGVKVPEVILHAHGQPHTDNLCLARLVNFAAILAASHEPPPGHRGGIAEGHGPPESMRHAADRA